MGNKNIKEQIVTESELEEAIVQLMDTEASSELKKNSLSSSLKIIHIGLKKEKPYQWISEIEAFKVNPDCIRIFYHPQYEKLLLKLLDYFVEQKNKILNQFSSYAKKKKWNFILRTTYFLITFLNPSIKSFFDSILIRSDIDPQAKELALKICQNEDYKIPNVLPSHDNKIKLIKQLRTFVHSLIVFRNGVADIDSEFIIFSFILYLQFYFDEDEELSEVANENIPSNLKIFTYMLAVSVQFKHLPLYFLCILFLQSILNHSQKLSNLQPIKLHRLPSIPVSQASTIYHQIVLLVVYGLQVDDEELEIDNLRVLRVLARLMEKIKLKGDNKILFYIDNLCKKTQMSSLERVYVDNFIHKYTKTVQLSTKKIQNFKTVAKLPYILITDEGKQQVQPSIVFSSVQSQFLPLVEEFRNCNVKFVFKYIYGHGMAYQENRRKIWNRVVKDSKPIQQKQSMMEKYSIQ